MSAIDATALPAPEDREEHSQYEDGGDDEQVVADELVEAEAGGDLGAAGRAEQHGGDEAGTDAEERHQELIDQASDHPAVTFVGELPHVDAEPALFQRAGDAVEPAGQPAQHGEQRGQLVGDGLLHGSWRHLSGYAVRRVRARFAGYVDLRRQQAEGAFQGAEGAQLWRPRAEWTARSGRPGGTGR